MYEIKSMSYEECRSEHFRNLMLRMQRKIDYWQYRGRYSLAQRTMLSQANQECSEAGMQYNFYKDALEALEDNKFQYETGFVKGFEAAQPKWISVEERLPETDDRVLFIDDGEVGFGIVRGWALREMIVETDIHRITHWMPLPSTEGIE